MRTVLSVAAGLALVLALTVGLRAEEKKEAKEVTLKGTITCAKCDLKKAKACATVIVTKVKDKEMVYYFDKDANKKYHKDICTDPKEGTVMGTVSKEGGKNIITVTSLTYKK